MCVYARARALAAKLSRCRTLVSASQGGDARPAVHMSVCLCRAPLLPAGRGRGLTHPPRPPRAPSPTPPRAPSPTRRGAHPAQYRTSHHRHKHAERHQVAMANGPLKPNPMRRDLPAPFHSPLPHDLVPHLTMSLPAAEATAPKWSGGWRRHRRPLPPPRQIRRRRRPPATPGMT